MKNIIEQAWESRANLQPSKQIKDAVEEAIAGLDSGKLRVAEKVSGEWITHQWLKKAVLLSFRLQDNRVMQAGELRYYDKVASKFTNYA
jgi:2,3,4,5-tetrahydropyridine-2,6-dicarboxylate N-succinyltransferase